LPSTCYLEKSKYLVCLDKSRWQSSETAFQTWLKGATVSRPFATALWRLWYVLPYWSLPVALVAQVLAISKLGRVCYLIVLKERLSRCLS
jgi:hypothetical protein